MICRPRVKDVFFYEPIILPEKSSREVQLTLHPLDDGGGSTFKVHSRPFGERGAEWSLNAEGTIVTDGSDVTGEPESEQAEPVDAAIERLDPHASAGSVRDLRRLGAGMGANLVWFPEVAVAR